jgi:hypothetical protein
MNVANVRSAGCLAAVSALVFAGVAATPHAAASVRTPSAARCYCASGPGPAAAAAPGGYSTVVTSRTITQSGGVIWAVRVAGGRVTLAVPAGAFPVQVQITLTAPKPGGAVNGYKVITGVGVQVQENGIAYPAAFRKPLTLTVRSPSAASSSLVVVWNGKRFVTEPHAAVVRGVVTVRFRSGTESDFAVLSPAAAAAVTSMTGKSFLNSGIRAAALLGLGVGRLAVAMHS